MISTQYINSVSAKPYEYDDFEIINVLKWNNSKWKTLCPYYLRTDGQELCNNPGNILFENFYQGLKVYDIIYANEVYPSKYQANNPAYLWWKYIPESPSGDIIYANDIMNYVLYYRWRNDLWSCQHPIRYPNKIHRRKNVKFAICVDKQGNEIRMDYLTTRKEMYVKEYIRLIRQLPEYKQLLEKIKKGKKLMICEVDVPAQGKKGLYGNDCNENNISIMSIEKLESLMNDTNEAFGHGLCLAYALLTDLEKQSNSIMKFLKKK